MNEYYEALKQCGYRYKELLNTLIEENNYWGWDESRTTYDKASKLWLFVDEFIVSCDKQLPLMKLNRWIGYIQGMLIAWDLTTVEKERDWSRPLFNPLDFPEQE